MSNKLQYLVTKMGSDDVHSLSRPSDAMTAAVGQLPRFSLDTENIEKFEWFGNADALERDKSSEPSSLCWGHGIMSPACLQQINLELKWPLSGGLFD